MTDASGIQSVFDLPPEVPFYRLAPLYDFIYRHEFDYDRQAERVRGVASAAGVLELACGTGRLAARLADGEYVGVDAATPMLEVARRNVDARFVRADARQVAFDRSFGAVAMLGRSSAHFGVQDLRSVADVAREHLDDGGGFVLDAHDRATLEDGYSSDDRYETDRWTVRYRGESTTTGGGWCTHEYRVDVRDRTRELSSTFEGSYEMRFWSTAEIREVLVGAGFGTFRVEAENGRIDATALLS
jgi:SAM-dependent methyltransferase